MKRKKNNIKTLIAQLSQFQDTLLNEYLGTYGVRYTHIMQQLYQLHDIATFGKKIIDLLAFRNFDKKDSIQIYAAAQFNGGITFYENNIEVSTGFNTKVKSIYCHSFSGWFEPLNVGILIDFADKMSTDYWLCISLESIFKIVEKEIEEKEKILKKLEEYPCLLPPYLLPYDCVNPISEELIAEGFRDIEEKLLEKNPYLKPLEQNLEKIRGKLHVIDKIVEESYRDEVFSKPILERMRVHEECIYLLNKEKIEKAANTVMDMLEINKRVMAYMHDTLIINSIKNRSWITRLFGYNPAKDFVIRTMDCDFNNLGLYLKTLRPDINLELEKPTLDNIRKIRNEYKDSDRFTICKAARELKDKYKATAVRLNNYNRAIDNVIIRLKENIEAVVSGYLLLSAEAEDVIDMTLSELDKF
ncbi:MAG: hypothetical protein J6P19_05660 [Acetobacter sp.]|nr:hypothetical protein [Acetobacter sp.]